MGSADWATLNDGLDDNTLKRAVTQGVFTPPNGGGLNVRGLRSLLATQGAAAFYTNLANFNPTAANKGASVRGAMQRAVSSGLTDFAPFMFANGQSNSVNGSAYMIGLSDDNPSRIVLRKGAIVSGLPAGAPGSSGNGVLTRSDESVDVGEWVHLRLDAIVNLTGEVVLKVFRNDLDSNAVTSPSWEELTEMAFVDDPLGAASGSLPYTSGYMGYGGFSKALNRIMLFDHFQMGRQT